MHISDGILSPTIIGIGWLTALPGLIISIRRLHSDQVGSYGVLAAAFFVASTIHIPIGPFNMHLVFNGIAGLFLGMAALTVITVGLLLQALLLGFGGLTVLGVNIVIMALPGALMGVLGRRWMLRASPNRRPLIGAIIASGTICISAVLLFIALLTTHPGLKALAKLIFLGHIPVALVEGMVNFWLVHLIQRVKPSMLGIRN